REPLRGALLLLALAGGAGEGGGLAEPPLRSGVGRVLRHQAQGEPAWRLGLAAERGAAEPGGAGGEAARGGAALLRAADTEAPFLGRVSAAPEPDRVLEAGGRAASPPGAF